MNHAVVAVGLGTSHDAGVDYYIIRNSWSTDWGMEGHFWIKRGENLCGISDCASFPLVPASSGEMDFLRRSTSKQDVSKKQTMPNDVEGTSSNIYLRKS